MSIGTVPGAEMQPSISTAAPVVQLDYATPALPAALPVAVPRNQGIDVVRLFAAIGIVFVHTTQSDLFEKWRNFFRFAVPFFLFASLYYQTLSFRRKKHVGLGEYIVSRFGRLYVPFLVWSVIYLIVRDVKRVTILHLPLAKVPLSVLWKGTEYHLWFLPFLLAASIVLVAIHKLILDKDPRWRWPLIVLAVVAGCVAISTGLPSGSGETFEEPIYIYYQWRLSLPTICWAMAFAWIMAAGPVIYCVSTLLGWIGIAVAVVFSVSQAAYGIQITSRTITGLGCIFAALSPWRGRFTPVLARFGRRGYGIYLCHVIPSEILKVVTRRTNLTTTPALDVVLFFISFACALGIVLLLERSKKTAWLNG